ncbi:MAG: family 10 glycosylhydrolase [Candidatus Marinimicrobia bacterium]|nr:family 10 glycosylhydrolase [Candidatus Neomarinimicrobiota bacterium]
MEDIHDWRRGNINLLVQSVMDSINEVKPWVKWGISPFGIYKPNIPEGITGMNAYATLYCDPLAWLQDGSVDYLTPQCYWPFGGGQDYGKLIPWWAEQTQRYGKHLYPGQAMYRAWTTDFPRGEIPRQIRLNRKTENCDGSVFFTANDFYDNHKNTIDSLRQNLYRYPSLWPVMSWKDSVPPAAPQNIEYIVETGGSKTLNWQAPAYTDPLDSALAYVVYRAPFPLEEASPMKYVKDIQFHRDQSFRDSDPGMYYYKITALDRNKLESVPGDIDYPFVHPLYPQYASVSVEKDTCFKWRDYEAATQYTLEISPSGDFDPPLYQLTLNDTVRELELSYDTQYSWRIKADNTPYWSPEWFFKTQLPPPIRIISPLAYYEGTDLDVTFRWHSYEDADSYEIRVARDPHMNEIVAQQSNISDTVWNISGLEPATGYYWRIRSNKYDNWNDLMYFKTRDENIETLWQYAAITEDLPVFLSGDSASSGLALKVDNGDSLLFVVSSSTGNTGVTVLNARNGEMLYMTLDLSGVEGGTYALRDIEVSEDGVIYACNGAVPGETFKIYQWTDPSQSPDVVYRADDIAYRLGDHITVSGRRDDGSIVIYAPASMSGKLVKLEWDNTAGGFNGQQIRLQNNNLGNACMAEVPGSDDMFVNSTGMDLIRYSRIGMFDEWTRNNPAMPIDANAIASFEYGGRNFVAAYSASSEAVHVIDASDNLSEASPAGSTYRLGINENPTADGDVEVLNNGDGTFIIYVLGNNNGLAAYTYDAASVITAVEDIAAVGEFSLDANYPNPFNPVTLIPYRLDRRRDIEIAVYDLSGKRIRTLFSGMQEAGRHTLRFDAADLSSGMYLCVLRSGNTVRTRKITLIK